MTSFSFPGAIATSFALVAATAALIAFHIGLLTLVGRERKSPYVIDLAFPVFLLSLLVVALSITAPLLPSGWSDTFIGLATGILVLAVLLSIRQVYRITVRFLYFVDIINFNHVPGIRQVRRWRKTLSRKPTYEHNPLMVPEALQKEILKVVTSYALGINGRATDDLSSLAIAIAHQSQANELLAKLATAFLKQQFTVQYMSAARHPIEFIGLLRSQVESREAWVELAKNRIVALDAYSPHFGFIDSIHHVKALEFESLEVSLVKSSRTYAGVHSAASKAFNLIKKQAGKDYRSPTLVIYEGAYALADLESAEQYRVFLRHVIPSEKMWGGMFTVFVECAPPEADWTVLSGYSSLSLDLRSAVQPPEAAKPAGKP